MKLDAAQENLGWEKHGRPLVPTVHHVRGLLVFALRHIAEAERRRACAAVFAGMSNRRAVELVRRAMKGRDGRERVSLLTWQIVRALGNATPHTAPKAWWNTERWLLHDRRVAARVTALKRGERPG